MSKNLNTGALAELRQDLGPLLKTSEQVTPPQGLPTGWPELDRYLLWQGFPKAAVSLMWSEAGGATRLWIKAAAPITQRQQWVAWVNAAESHLTPWALRHQGVNLAHVLTVSAPSTPRQLLWALQELMSLCLFEMIGCDLGLMPLRESQILKLKKLALRYQTALVLITHDKKARLSPFYSLILSFERHHVMVKRALHRPTPHQFERRDLYADTLPLLAAGRRALCG